jgi:hypothetical protein
MTGVELGFRTGAGLTMPGSTPGFGLTTPPPAPVGVLPRKEILKCQAKASRIST